MSCESSVEGKRSASGWRRGAGWAAGSEHCQRADHSELQPFVRPSSTASGRWRMEGPLVSRRVAKRRPSSWPPIGGTVGPCPPWPTSALRLSTSWPARERYTQAGITSGTWRRSPRSAGSGRISSSQLHTGRSTCSRTTTSNRPSRGGRRSPKRAVKVGRQATVVRRDRQGRPASTGREMPRS